MMLSVPVLGLLLLSALLAALLPSSSSVQALDNGLARTPQMVSSGQQRLPTRPHLSSIPGQLSSPPLFLSPCFLLSLCSALVCSGLLWSGLQHVESFLLRHP